MTEAPNVTLDQLQQAVMHLRFARRRASEIALDRGKKPSKAQVKISELNTIIYWLGSQERIAELYAKDTTP